jgi:hypothetical protein
MQLPPHKRMRITKPLPKEKTNERTEMSDYAPMIGLIVALSTY